MFSCPLELREAVAQMGTSAELHQIVCQSGMVPFRDGAMALVQAGITSLDEALRVVPADLLGLEG
ncbi:MAG: hypothetical protein KDA60_08300 [Planctomycetales bacterium]|nr:hypothetical protein [Planctomycetales bacterium]